MWVKVAFLLFPKTQPEPKWLKKLWLKKFYITDSIERQVLLVLNGKDIVKLEIEAQHKLLAISKHLQWSDVEIEQIKRALARWEIELSALP